MDFELSQEQRAWAERFATDAGFAICNEALQLEGGYGYVREYPIERHLRDSRAHREWKGPTRSCV